MASSWTVSAQRVFLASTLLVLFSTPSRAQTGLVKPDDQTPQTTGGFGGLPTPPVPTKRTPSSETAKQVAVMLDTFVELGEVDSSISDFANYLSSEGVPTFIDQRGLTIAGQTPETKLKASSAKTPLRSALRKLLAPLNLRAIVDDDGLLITADFEQLTLAGISISQAVTSDSKAHKEILGKLQQKISVSFSDTPLDEALQSVAKQTSVNVILDRLALEEIGITPDTPVDCELKSVSFESVLRILLRELTLTYQVKDQVLQITTLEAAEQNLVGRIYFLESTGFDAQHNAMQVIKSTIIPDTWESLGGPSTMALLFAGPYQRPAIMVSAPSDVHAQLGDLFQALRAAETK